MSDKDTASRDVVMASQSLGAPSARRMPTPWFVIARTVYADNGKPVIDLGWHRCAPGVLNPGEADPVRDAIEAVNAGRIGKREARAALAKAVGHD